MNIIAYSPSWATDSRSAGEEYLMFRVTVSLHYSRDPVTSSSPDEFEPMKMAVLWVVALCIQVEFCRRFRGVCCPDDGRSTYFWNVNELLPENTMKEPRSCPAVKTSILTIWIKSTELHFIKIHFNTTMRATSPVNLTTYVHASVIRPT